MSNKFEAKKYEPGEIIIDQGVEGHHLVYIVEGMVEIVKDIDGDVEIVATLSSGDILGEMALLTGEPRNASARAAEKTRIIEIQESIFKHALICDELPILRDIMIQLGKRIQILEATNAKYLKRIAELEQQVLQQRD